MAFRRQPASRRTALIFILGLLSACSPLPAIKSGADPAPSKVRVYAGTYTGSKAKGIYRMDLDLSSGSLSAPELAGEITSPSFLALHPTGRFLYSVNEVGDFGGKKSGAVSAFSIDPQSGNLALLNQQPSGGSGPCHITIDKAGTHALVANYGSGSAAVLPIGADGKLGEATSVQQHAGTSANPQRQEGPHAHSINLDAGNRFAFVADLGLDKVMIYRFGAGDGSLTPGDPPSASVSPGAGPRHFAFHPGGRYAYVINELHNTLTAFEYDAGRGELKTIQTMSTLPEGFKGASYTAEVQVHPSGKFLYGSNRGHNSIAVFAIDPQTGKLQLVDHQAGGIKTPRNFGIDPTGAFLLAANQDGDSILVFRIDPATGRLLPTTGKAAVPSPVCVKMMPIP